jgi:hypothetical protein
LTEGVTYYVRAYATNQKGTAYGSEETIIAGGSIPSGPPVLSVSRTQMNFTVMLSGANIDTMTGSQRFFIVNTGEGTLEWTASPSDNWIDVSPASGAGDALVSVSINPMGFTPGENSGSLLISAPDAENSPQTLNIYLRVADKSEDTPPAGSFDTPIDGSRVSGSIPVTGWAIDDVQVTTVAIYRDPMPGEGNQWKYIGDAVFVEGARPDVETLYAGYPNNSTAGWGYMMLTHFLPNGGNGAYTIHAQAVDTVGHKTLLGSKTITCDNANAIKPFGAVDTPSQGGITGGNDYLNWGWALTPQPNYIPYDGSTLTVFVDGKNLGSPTYNIYRKDIARLFPGYVNSNGAIGYFYLDTTAFLTGIHTIAWQARDSAGNADGIGSRYFIIVNPGASNRTAGISSIPSAAVPSTPTGRENPGESPTSPSPYLSVRSGWRPFDEEQPMTTPDNQGIFHIETRELEPIKILPPQGTTYTSAHLLVNNNRRPLPPGAGLDPSTGAFHWMPGPAFIGLYTIVLNGIDPDGEKVRDPIVVTIKPLY